jgi:hypothetical protein
MDGNGAECPARIDLADYLHSHANAAIIEKLILCHVDADLSDAIPNQLAKWKFPAVHITNDHLEIASLAWRAYRAPTPQPWFNLLNKDLSVSSDGVCWNCSKNFQGV